MNVELARADVLRDAQRRLIERYEGRPGVRGEGALESGIAPPANLVACGDVSSIAELGAALTWALLRNHSLADGNKRAAFAALTISLDINGYELTCSEVEVVRQLRGTDYFWLGMKLLRTA